MIAILTFILSIFTPWNILTNLLPQYYALKIDLNLLRGILLLADYDFNISLFKFYHRLNSFKFWASLVSKSNVI